MVARATRLNQRVIELGQRFGISTPAPRREWYGLDPIHVLRRLRDAAWRELLAPWFDDSQPSTFVRSDRLSPLAFGGNARRTPLVRGRAELANNQLCESPMARRFGYTEPPCRSFTDHRAVVRVAVRRADGTPAARLAGDCEWRACADLPLQPKRQNADRVPGCDRPIVATIASGIKLNDGIRVVYVSPLRALSNDMHRNLDTPLREISELVAQADLRTIHGEKPAPIRVGLRTGDTSSSQRATLVRKPPHILVSRRRSRCT